MRQENSTARNGMTPVLSISKRWGAQMGCYSQKRECCKGVARTTAWKDLPKDVQDFVLSKSKIDPISKDATTEKLIMDTIACWNDDTISALLHKLHSEVFVYVPNEGAKGQWFHFDGKWWICTGAREYLVSAVKSMKKFYITYKDRLTKELEDIDQEEHKARTKFMRKKIENVYNCLKNLGESRRIHSILTSAANGSR